MKGSRTLPDLPRAIRGHPRPSKSDLWTLRTLRERSGDPPGGLGRASGTPGRSPKRLRDSLRPSYGLPRIPRGAPGAPEEAPRDRLRFSRGLPGRSSGRRGGSTERPEGSSGSSKCDSKIIEKTYVFHRFSPPGQVVAPRNAPRKPSRSHQTTSKRSGDALRTYPDATDCPRLYPIQQH